MLNPRRDADLCDLAAATGGALDLAGCRQAGLSDRRVRELVATGRWQSPFRRVYVTFSGPIPALTMHHAALLYAGDGAALGHETAGWLWRLCKQPIAIHLLVPYARAVAGQRGLVIHRSRTLSDQDIHPVRLPRRTRVERTVLDMLSTRATGFQALGLVGDAMRVTTAERIRLALLGRPGTRWRREILDALPDISAGARSILELKDAAMRRAHGLPLGERQFGRCVDGSEYLDVLIEEFGVHVELDGRLGHDKTRDVWRDMRRDNRSEVARLRHFRYGWADMVDRPCEIAREQADVLTQQGWRGEFVRCPRCPTKA